MSPDPHSGTVLHVLNPQRWNMYAYALNNPLFYVDPTGMDAIAVGFTNLAVHLGHVGIVSLHSDGSATFGEFGPSRSGTPVWTGKITEYGLNTKVEFGQDGKPTQASLNALRDEIAGRDNEPAGNIMLVDFKTTDAEASNIDNWFKEQLKNPEWWVYHVGEAPWDTDCRDFLRQGLNAAGQHFTRAQFLRAPNNLFNWLAEQPGATPLREKVTHKIYDDQGNVIGGSN